MIKRTLRIKLPVGISLPLATNLLAHIENRTSTPPFRLGDWLSILSKTDIDALSDQSSIFKQLGAQVETDDFVMVAAQAFQAEGNIALDEDDVEKLEDVVKNLALCISLENLRRAGMIRIKNVLSLNPNYKAEIEITEQGQKYEQALAARRKALH